MKTNYSPQRNESSATAQLVVVLTNSKYTYAQFTDFHETVLNMLEYSDLSHLSNAQMKNTVFFINVVISLLDAPKRAVIMQKREDNFNTDPLAGDKRQEHDNAISVNERNTLARDRANARGKAMDELLQWINQLVYRSHMTIEDLLDEFFNLNFIKNRNTEGSK